MVKWNLKDIVPSFTEESLDKTFKSVDKKVKEFEGFREKLNPNISSKDVFSIIEASAKISRELRLPSHYVGLKLTENTGSHKWNATSSKIDQFSTDIANRMMFFSLWWKDLDEDNANRILKDLGKHKHIMEDSRKFKKHTLKENEEKIINVKDITGAGAISNIYDIITNAYTFDFNGKTGISQTEVMEAVKKEDPKLRKEAYETVLGKYAKEESVLGELYRNIVLDWTNEGLKLRNYNSSIAIRNLGNDIPDKAVDVLLDVCKKNVRIFQDYFKLKAKLIGMKKLGRYDIYAPISGKHKEISYDDALKTVLGVFGSFESKFYELANRVVKEKHIHSDIQKGKQSGAFCSSSLPELTPYVLLNWVGNYNDMSTLAHELGHAIHSMLAEDKTLFDFHSSLPLAETASIFSEMLLEEELLKRGMPKDEEIHLLATQIDGIYASVIRQAYFVIFEKKAHEMMQKGATIGELNDVWIKDLRQQLGDAVGVDDIFKHEWKYIPHIFHHPFYCYAYSFGNLLVLSLFKMYKEEGDSFIPKYKKILSYGGSEVPEKILAEAGIDINDEKFWQGGFDLIKEMVERLKVELGK
tara:strand:- start:5165 stop:6913 length:1749 start_codon:yes stop_codon:yes gene_type:complete